MLGAVLGVLVAGALTTLAPCALSLLPVVVGGSLHGAGDVDWGRRRALLVAGGLAALVIAFTLVLRASTAPIDIPPATWRLLSGGLLVVLSILTAVPALWDRVSLATGLGWRSATALHHAHRTGGPVAPCSPALRSARSSPRAARSMGTSLSPSSRLLPRALALLLAYVAGLVSVLLTGAAVGQAAVRHLPWGADPESLWRRGGAPGRLQTPT